MGLPVRKDHKEYREPPVHKVRKDQRAPLDQPVRKALKVQWAAPAHKALRENKGRQGQPAPQGHPDCREKQDLPDREGNRV